MTCFPIPKLYYVAAKLEDHEEAQVVRDQLNALGLKQTYDWTSWLEREANATPKVYEATAIAEIQGVVDAELCVFILPGGRGFHAELGAALAMWTCHYKRLDTDEVPRIVLIGDKPDGCVFYHHPAIEFFPTFEAFLETVR